jgi:hypothetical protein
MSTEKRINPAIWAGLMGIGTVSVPSCAYAATTSASFGLPHEFVIGAAAGGLAAAGAIVVFLKVSRRRRQARERAEERTAVVDYSMPVGDNVQVADVDALMMEMTPKDQMASQYQVERLALGIEGEFVTPIASEEPHNVEEPHSVPAEKVVESSRSVREVLLERLDGDGIEGLPVIKASGGMVENTDTGVRETGFKGAAHTGEGRLEPMLASPGAAAKVTDQSQVTPAIANASTASMTTGSKATVPESSMVATKTAARVPSLAAAQAAPVARIPPVADSVAGKAVLASPRTRTTCSAVTPEMRKRAAIIAQRVPRVCPERRPSAASTDKGGQKPLDSAAASRAAAAASRAAARRRALDRVAMVVALNAAVSRRLVAAVRADEHQSHIGPTSTTFKPRASVARVAARRAHDESEMPTESLLTREKELHEDLGLAS